LEMGWGWGGGGKSDSKDCFRSQKLVINHLIWLLINGSLNEHGKMLRYEGRSKNNNINNISEPIVRTSGLSHYCV
jgi:hypothetical protein